ncbi:MAG: response regulator [Bacteroidetes bacterium]|nr:response regulator [Bacteroidota bacterium]
MIKKLNCILLIDDNPDDNFYHERVIQKSNAAHSVLAKTSAKEALDFLAAKKAGEAPPELILLDINMPGMNGWDFLEAYQKLDSELKSQAVVVMLTTSQNPDDKKKAEKINIISDFKTKPLTKETLEEILIAFFSEK